MIDSLIVMSEIANNDNKRVHRKRNKNKQQEKTEYSKNANTKQIQNILLLSNIFRSVHV